MLVCHSPRSSCTQPVPPPPLPRAALATARYVPPAAVLDALAARLEALLAQPSGKPGGSGGGAPGAAVAPLSLAWCLWAFGRLRYRPSRRLLRRVEAALRGPQVVGLYGLEPADVARLCWGLAEARHYSGE